MADNFCPQCGARLEPGQTKCSFCGKELSNPSPAPTPPPAVPQYTSQNVNQSSNYQDNTANYSYQSAVPTVEPSAPKSSNGLQIAGLVLGILGIVTCCCYGIVGIILSIAGLVCSILGNKEGKTGIGTAGFVCSIIGIIFGVISLIYYIIIIAIGSSSFFDEYLNSYYY